jgi:anti-anti-sigma factor
MGESRRVTLAIETGLMGDASMTLLDHVRALPFGNFDALHMNLKSVGEVDVSGIAVLVRIYSHLRRLGKRLVLTDVSDAVQHRLGAIGLDKVISVQPRDLAATSKVMPPVSHSDLITGR